jgi:DNA-binding beta-propeller fold protein YncE
MKRFAVLAVLVLFVSAIAHADTIYVTCPGSLAGPDNGKIVKFDPGGNGTVFASWLVGPSGAAFDSSGSLYVANTFTQTIDKFNASGTKTSFISGTSMSALWNPRGIAFDNNGNLYVANVIIGITINGVSSPNQSWIEKFSSNGVDLGAFASGFSHIKGLAFDGAGNLYASDYDAGSIMKLDASGNKTTFASGLVSPDGLAFGNGNLYAADYNRGRIDKFDASGNSTAFATGLLNPTGLAFDGGGNLYASNYGNGTIMKFDPSGNNTVFASGLSRPTFIAVQIPEPATIGLMAMGAMLVRRKH